MSYDFPPDLLLALNGYASCTRVLLRGKNAAISNSAETVWSPGSTYARLTTATALEVLSGSASDAAAGTGARTILVTGVGAAYAAQSETVTLNGVTPVALTNTYLAVNSVTVATAGSGGTNAGAITIRTVSGSVTKAQISTDADLGIGQAAGFLYTVPAGWKAVLKPVTFSATGVTGDLTVYVLATTSAGVSYAVGSGKSSLYVTGFNAAQGYIDLGVGQVFEAGTQIELRAIVSAGAGDLVAMGELFLVKAPWTQV